MPIQKLTNLAPGQSATIHRMPTRPDVSLRLHELGLGVGREITCTSARQLYDFRSTRYMFNKDLTEQILIENVKALSAFNCSV